MAQLLKHQPLEQAHVGATSTLDWRRKMSSHAAFALVAYTTLQIFLTASILKSNHDTILPYLALFLLVVGVIPGFRMFEKRWSELSDEQASNPELAKRFARDRLMIWATALMLPFALLGFFKGVAFLVA